MTKTIRLTSFILLIIGTLGLLINEFAFDWGSAATLTFGAMNVVGLTTLAFAFWGMKSVHRT